MSKPSANNVQHNAISKASIRGVEPEKLVESIRSQWNDSIRQSRMKKAKKMQWKLASMISGNMELV